MIDAKELRIGNWVNLYEGQDSQVTGLTEDGAVWCVRSPANKACAWEKVNPISLTEEWLLGFGFEWTKSNKQDSHLGIWLNKEESIELFFLLQFRQTN